MEKNLEKKLNHRKAVEYEPSRLERAKNNEYKEESVPFLLDGKPITDYHNIEKMIDDLVAKGELSLNQEESIVDPIEEDFLPIEAYTHPERTSIRNSEEVFRKNEIDRGALRKETDAHTEQLREHWIQSLSGEPETKQMAERYAKEQEERERQEMAEYRAWAEEMAKGPHHNESYATEPSDSHIIPLEEGDHQEAA